jgi:HK97 gp10 family phage protein
VRIGRIDPRVVAALTRVPSVKKQMRTVANEVRKDARRLAPRDTGNLRRGIAVDNVLDDKGQVEFRVGWTNRAWYGSLVELGTEDTPPRPHLRPAAIKVGGRTGRRTR